MVIDPPRAEDAAQVAFVAMISCNPTTFTHAAHTLLDAGYGSAPIMIVDKFRWSAYVTLATPFTRS